MRTVPLSIVDCAVPLAAMPTKPVAATNVFRMRTSVRGIPMSFMIASEKRRGNVNTPSWKRPVSFFPESLSRCIVTRSILVTAGLLAVAACSTEPVSVQGRARFYNGATPGAPTGGANRSAVAGTGPINGGWQVSPDKITLHLRQIFLQSTQTSSAGSTEGPQTTADVDCLVTYDKSQPGLTQLADCPFTVDTGTYSAVTLFFDGSMEMLVNDPVNNLYTTAT